MEQSKGRGRQYLLYSLVIFTVFLIPWLQSNLGEDPTVLPRFILLAIGLALLSIWSIIHSFHKEDDPGLSLLQRPVLWFAFGYFLFSALSGFSAISFAEWLYETLKAGLFFASIYLITRVLLRSKNPAVPFAQAVTISVILLGIIGILQYHLRILDFSPSPTMPHGRMWHRNLFAGFLLISSPFLILGWLRLNKAWKIPVIFALLLTIYNIVISTARSSWLAVVWGVATTGILYVITRPKKDNRSQSVSVEKTSIKKKGRRKKKSGNPPERKKQSELIALFITLMIAIVVLSFALNEINVRKSDTGRLNWWKQTVRMFSDHPLLGVGAGNWKLQHPKYGYQEKPDFIAIARPHNDFLWVLAETGIFGFISYGGLFLILLFYAYRLARQYEDEEDRATGLIFFFALMSYIVLAFFSYPRERIEHTLWLALLASFPLAAYHTRFPLTGKTPRLVHAGLSLFLIFVSSFAVFDGVVRLYGDYQVKEVEMDRKNKDYKSMERAVTLAYSPFYTMNHFSNPILGYRGYARLMMNDEEEAERDFKEALRESPYNVKLINNLARIYAYRKDYEIASGWFARTLEISPRDLTALKGMVEMQFLLGNYDRVFQMIDQFDPERKKPKVQEYRQKLMQEMNKRLGKEGDPTRVN